MLNYFVQKNIVSFHSALCVLDKFATFFSQIVNSYSSFIHILDHSTLFILILVRFFILPSENFLLTILLSCRIVSNICFCLFRKIQLLIIGKILILISMIWLKEYHMLIIPSFFSDLIAITVYSLKKDKNIQFQHKNDIVKNNKTLLNKNKKLLNTIIQKKAFLDIFFTQLLFSIIFNLSFFYQNKNQVAYIFIFTTTILYYIQSFLCTANLFIFLQSILILISQSNVISFILLSICNLLWIILRIQKQKISLQNKQFLQINEVNTTKQNIILTKQLTKNQNQTDQNIKKYLKAYKQLNKHLLSNKIKYQILLSKIIQFAKQRKNIIQNAYINHPKYQQFVCLFQKYNNLQQSNQNQFKEKIEFLFFKGYSFAKKFLFWKIRGFFQNTNFQTQLFNSLNNKNQNVILLNKNKYSTVLKINYYFEIMNKEQNILLLQNNIEIKTNNKQYLQKQLLPKNSIILQEIYPINAILIINLNGQILGMNEPCIFYDLSIKDKGKIIPQILVKKLLANTIVSFQQTFSCQQQETKNNLLLCNNKKINYLMFKEFVGIFIIIELLQKQEPIISINQINNNNHQVLIPQEQTKYFFEFYVHKNAEDTLIITNVKQNYCQAFQNQQNNFFFLEQTSNIKTLRLYNNQIDFFQNFFVQNEFISYQKNISLSLICPINSALKKLQQYSWPKKIFFLIVGCFLFLIILLVLGIINKNQLIQQKTKFLQLLGLSYKINSFYLQIIFQIISFTRQNSHNINSSTDVFKLFSQIQVQNININKMYPQLQSLYSATKYFTSQAQLQILINSNPWQKEQFINLYLNTIKNNLKQFSLELLQIYSIKINMIKIYLYIIFTSSLVLLILQIFIEEKNIYKAQKNILKGLNIWKKLFGVQKQLAKINFFEQKQNQKIFEEDIQLFNQKFFTSQNIYQTKFCNYKQIKNNLKPNKQKMWIRISTGLYFFIIMGINLLLIKQTNEIILTTEISYTVQNKINNQIQCLFSTYFFLNLSPNSQNISLIQFQKKIQFYLNQTYKEQQQFIDSIALMITEQMVSQNFQEIYQLLWYNSSCQMFNISKQKCLYLITQGSVQVFAQLNLYFNKINKQMIIKIKQQQEVFDLNIINFSLIDNIFTNYLIAFSFFLLTQIQQEYFFQIKNQWVTLLGFFSGFGIIFIYLYLQKLQKQWKQIIKCLNCYQKSYLQINQTLIQLCNDLRI